jgi:hypothetical protein
MLDALARSEQEAASDQGVPPDTALDELRSSIARMTSDKPRRA